MSCGVVLGVVGASGGVGASTMTVALGVVALRGGLRCVCLDARPLGGGLDVVAGLDREPGLRWPQLDRVDGPVPGSDLLAHLPCTARLPVLSHGRQGAGEVPDAAAEGVLAGLREAVDLCVVDLPGVSHPGWSWWSSRVDTLLLVAGHVLPALAAASVVAPMVPAPPGGVWLAQRVGRRHGDLPEVSGRVLDLPVAAGVPDDPGVARALHRGQPPAGSAGPLRRSCETTLAVLGCTGGQR